MRFCCSTSSSRTLASFRSAQDFACMATNRDISQLVFFDPKPLKDFEDWKTRRPGGAGSEVSGSPPLPLWQSTNAADALQLLLRRAGAVHPVAAIHPAAVVIHPGAVTAHAGTVVVHTASAVVHAGTRSGG